MKGRERRATNEGKEMNTKSVHYIYKKICVWGGGREKGGDKEERRKNRKEREKKKKTKNSTQETHNCQYKRKKKEKRIAHLKREAEGVAAGVAIK